MVKTSHLLACAIASSLAITLLTPTLSKERDDVLDVYTRYSQEITSLTERNSGARREQVQKAVAEGIDELLQYEKQVPAEILLELIDELVILAEPGNHQGASPESGSLYRDPSKSRTSAPVSSNPRAEATGCPCRNLSDVSCARASRQLEANPAHS